MGLQITVDHKTGIAQVTNGGKIVIKDWHLADWKRFQDRYKEGEYDLFVRREEYPNKGGHTRERWTDDGSMLVFWTSEPRSDRAVADVTKEFGEFRKEWLKSKEYGILVSQLKELTKDASRSPITNVVAMATGSLCSKPGKPLPRVIQNPDYSKLDHELLTSLGLRVVHDPDAFEYICSNSLVYVVGPPPSVPRWVSLGPRPKATFFNDYTTNLHHFGGPYPDGWLDTIYDLFDDYKELTPIEGKGCDVPYNAPGRDLLFGGGRLWWRKSTTVTKSQTSSDKNH